MNKNSDVLLNSSSGGVFYNIARYVIEKEGVVIGVKFDKNYNAVYDFTSDIKDINCFMTSKYVQATNVDNIFYKAKEFLNEKKLVLFVGTPCCVQSLLNYLQIKYCNLVTIDFVCHGVPSPGIWKKYINNLAKGRKIKNINFRSKEYGWNNFSLKIEYENNTEYIKQKDVEPYISGFLQNVILRPSCFKCKFRNIHRNSDFTIADGWGADIIYPEKRYFDGVSFLLMHSESANKIWNIIKDNFDVIYPKDISQIIEYNTAAIEQTNRPKKELRDFTFGKSSFSIHTKLSIVTGIAIWKKVVRKLIAFTKIKYKIDVEFINEDLIDFSKNNIIYDKAKYINNINTRYIGYKDISRESKRFPILYNSREECCGCTACKEICPRNAIIMKSDVEGFLYPVVNVDKCISCKACELVCPFK